MELPLTLIVCGGFLTALILLASLYMQHHPIDLPFYKKLKALDFDIEYYARKEGVIFYQLKTPLAFFNGMPMEIHIVEDKDNVFFYDNGATIRVIKALGLTSEEETSTRDKIIKIWNAKLDSLKTINQVNIVYRCPKKEMLKGLKHYLQLLLNLNNWMFLSVGLLSTKDNSKSKNKSKFPSNIFTETVAHS